MWPNFEAGARLRQFEVGGRKLRQRFGSHLVSLLSSAKIIGFAQGLRPAFSIPACCPALRCVTSGIAFPVLPLW